MASKRKFVGRETELALLREMLKAPYGDKRILLVLGDGGIGKTYLVREMLAVADEQGFLVPGEPIDLFSTDYRHIDGIQWRIKEILESLPALKGKPSPFAEWIRGKTDTSEKFYEHLKAFCGGNPLVLAFDTFENLDKVASDWLFRGEPNGLQVPGLICIVAGRNNEKADIDTYRKNPLVNEAYVSGFTYQQAEDFYRKIIEDNKVKNSQTKEEKDPYDDLLRAAGLPKDNSLENSIEWVLQITNGHPLRLEMVFQWLGTLLGSESLKDLTVDKFDERLMGQVRELAEREQLDAGAGKKVSQPVYDTLLCMAHITRRFDEDFLQYFIDQKLIRLDDPKVTKRDITDSLEEYFFVKMRQSSGAHEVIQLHDEMALLVRKYIWPFIDPSGEQRDELHRAVIKLYDRLILGVSTELADIMQIEQLYYMLQLDEKGLGLQRWLELSESGNENINKLLPGEIVKYLNNNYYDDETLVRFHSTIAEMERNASHIKQAVGHWEQVHQLGEKNKREDWVVDSLIGLFNCKWMTEPEEALHHYLEPARAICEKRFPEKLAIVYYETGFAHRQMQDLELAVSWYEKGIQRFRESPDDTSLDGTLLNDTGYAYLHLGIEGEADRYLKEGLEIRQERLQFAEKQLEKASPESRARLGAARNQAALFVGLSRNTLGESHRYANELDEALKDYDEAYKRFLDVNDYYWQAKCLCARGETYRRIALQARERGREDSIVRGYGEKARQDIEESLYLCEKYQLDDERDTAYRRLGRLSHDLGLIEYGQRKVTQAQEKLEEAYQYFNRGWEFAHKTKETLEELENLTELAFLADDAIIFYANGEVPEYYRDGVKKLEKALKQHKRDPQRIYQYPVFEALMKMEKAAIAYTEGDFQNSLKGYVEAYKGLGIFPGYGHARYRQHFGHLTQQIESLPKDEQIRWCSKFINVWKKTTVLGQESRTLADELLPDLVKWCNRLLKGLDNK